MLIEQAVFTSAKTDRAQGYQLLARSPGLAEADARELSVWGPSHGSLCERAAETGSINFFRLSSGAYSISQTSLAGAEYSGRGGGSVYTQFLVVPGELLARFANNPFAILRAATASGLMCVLDSVPDILPTLQLAGRAPAVDLELMAQLAHEPGPDVMATLIQATLAADRLAVCSQAPFERLVAGVINLLPVECRGEISFATGLKSSPTRPVRLVSLPDDANAWRSIARSGVTLLTLESEASEEPVHWQGWAAWAAMALESGKLSLLAGELEQSRPGLTCDTLDQLADQLQTSLPAAAMADPADPQSRDESNQMHTAHMHAAHHRAGSALLVDSQPRTVQLDALAGRLAEQPPEILEMLERVDDLVFTAIAGNVRALNELEVLWPLLASELDEELVEQSREQYLRCALSICSECVAGQTQRPERAMAAVEVLCVLFEE